MGYQDDARKPLGIACFSILCIGLTACGGSPKSLAFSPDGSLLAVAGDERLSVWTVPGGTKLSSPWSPVGPDHKSPVAFSPDGLSIAEGHRGGFTVYSITDGSIRTRLGTEGTVSGDVIAFCDSRTVVHGSVGEGLVGGVTTVWALSGEHGHIVASDASGKWSRITEVNWLGLPFRGAGAAAPVSISCSADGQWLAIAYYGLKRSPPVQLVDTRALVKPEDHSSTSTWVLEGEGARRISFLGDATRLIGCSETFDVNNDKTVSASKVVIWDIRTRRIDRVFPFRSCEGFVVATKSPSLIVGGWNGSLNKMRIELWRPDTGSFVRTFDGNRVASLALSPDGSTLAAGYEDGIVRIWSVLTGRLVRELKL